MIRVMRGKGKWEGLEVDILVDGGAKEEEEWS